MNRVRGRRRHPAALDRVLIGGRRCRTRRREGARFAASTGRKLVFDEDADRGHPRARQQGPSIELTANDVTLAAGEEIMISASDVGVNGGALEGPMPAGPRPTAAPSVPSPRQRAAHGRGDAKAAATAARRSSRATRARFPAARHDREQALAVPQDRRVSRHLKVKVTGPQCSSGAASAPAPARERPTEHGDRRTGPTRRSARNELRALPGLAFQIAEDGRTICVADRGGTSRRRSSSWS